MARPKKEAPNRADGQYEVKMTVGKDFRGSPIRKSFYSPKSKADARLKGQEYIAQARAATLNGTAFVQATTFSAWAQKWLETYIKGTVKDNTYTGTYEIPVRLHLTPYFGNRVLDDILPIHIQQYFKERGKVAALETLKKEKTCLSGIFETAVENEKCLRNPVTKRLKLTSEIEPAEKHAYTQEQYDRIIAFAETHPLGLSILILAKTAISRSELLGIGLDDVSPGQITINNGLVEQKNSETGVWELVCDGLKNPFRRRIVPIDDDLSDRLLKVPRVLYVGGNKRRVTPPREVRPEKVIHSPMGLPYNPSNWEKRVYNKFMEDMHAANPDIPIYTPHELRHTRATLWHGDAVDLLSIAKLLGHCDLNMLRKVYDHTDVEMLRAAISKTKLS